VFAGSEGVWLQWVLLGAGRRMAGHAAGEKRGCAVFRHVLIR